MLWYASGVVRVTLSPRGHVRAYFPSIGLEVAALAPHPALTPPEVFLKLSLSKLRNLEFCLQSKAALRSFDGNYLRESLERP